MKGIKHFENSGNTLLSKTYRCMVAGHTKFHHHYICFLNTLQQHNFEQQTLIKLRSIYLDQIKLGGIHRRNGSFLKKCRNTHSSATAITTLTNIILQAGKHHLPKVELHKLCKLLQQTFGGNT